MVKSGSKLASMSVDALLQLRDEIAATLSQKSRELQGQLQRLGVLGVTRRRRAGRSHPRKGMKVAPKYRGACWRDLGGLWCIAEMADCFDEGADSVPRTRPFIEIEDLPSSERVTRKFVFPWHRPQWPPSEGMAERGCDGLFRRRFLAPAVSGDSETGSWIGFRGGRATFADRFFARDFEPVARAMSPTRRGLALALVILAVAAVPASAGPGVKAGRPPRTTTAIWEAAAEISLHVGEPRLHHATTIGMMAQRKTTMVTKTTLPLAPCDPRCRSRSGICRPG
jgi:hypothetical protein